MFDTKVRVTEETRLIKTADAPQAYSDEMPDTLPTILHWYAHLVESGLMSAGTNVGDYTLLDLYKLAQPFALAEWNRDSITLVQTT